jgi:alpha-tubulin suppressor-like RCC1 family protein
VTVKGVTNAVELEAGGAFACARRSSGTISCWGSGGDGQLGDGSTSGRGNEPVQVADIDNAVDLTVGESHSCVLVESGEVYCWGRDNYGAIGNDEERSDAVTPAKVKGLDNVVDVAAAPDSAHTCAALADGTVWCWGKNLDGQLGNDGDISRQIPVPSKVQQLDSAVSVMVGGTHSCAILADGTVRCWGNNEQGQLVVSTPMTHSHEPVQIPGIQEAAAGDAAFNETCVKTVAGALKCWPFYGSDETPVRISF